MTDTIVYNIENVDGTISFTIQPKIIDGPGFLQQKTDLFLCGNAAPYWGEKFNENLIRLLQNFAIEQKTGSTFPEPKTSADYGLPERGINNPQTGQLWYNKTNSILYVKVPDTSTRTNYWKPANAPLVGGTVPTENNTGTLWYDSNTSQLKIWSGTAWVSVADRYVLKSGDTMTGRLIMSSAVAPQIIFSGLPRGGIAARDSSERVRCDVSFEADLPTVSLRAYNANGQVINTFTVSDTSMSAASKILYEPSVLITDANQLVTKQYVDSVSGGGGGVFVDAVNLGTTGSRVFHDDNSNTLKFRRLTTGTDFTLTETADAVNITIADTSSLVRSGANIGTGTGEVYSAASGSQLQFRKIKAGTNVTVTTTGNDVVIDAAGGGGGGITGGANVGGGSQVYKGVSGSSLQFRTLLAGTGVSFSQQADTVTVSASATGFPTGTRMVFNQAAAPTGWTQVTDITTTYAMRVVANGSTGSDAGGQTGGTDNPFYMDKVPSHTHVVSGNTGTGSPHNHNIYGSTSAITDDCAGARRSNIRGFAGSLSSEGEGYFGTFGANGTAGIQNESSHAHAFSVTSAANSGASGWSPRYHNVIIASKT